MHIFKMIGLAAAALPAIAIAQVGPNPAVSGGSQDPTVGSATDSVTSPQDVRIGAQASGNVLDRQVGTGASATVSDGGAAASAGAGSASSSTTMPTTDPQTAAKPRQSSRRSSR